MNEPVTAASGARGLLRRVWRTSLATKITTVGVGVTAFVVVAAFWALHVETRNTTRVLITEQLSRHQRTLLQLQRQNLSQLISSAAIITQSPTLRSALETYRLESSFGGATRPDLVNTVRRELAKLLVQIDEDLLLVTDQNGKVFAAATRSGAEPRAGTSLARMHAVARALDPEAPADSGELAVLRDSRAAYQVAVYPLVLAGNSIGALLLGERLDDGLVASARAAFDGDIVVTAGDTVLASTLDPDAVAASALRRLGDGDAPATIQVGNQEMVVAPMALGQTQTGTAVQLWLMQPLQRTTRAITEPLRRDFVLYGMLAILVAAIGSGLAVRSVLMPFRRFVAYMRSGAAAERLDAGFADHDMPAEVRTLNSSLQHLMRSISAKQQQLSERTTELTAANAVLVDEVRERKRIEQELLERDEQLRQSQKLEAIGTLAGGIAHDFNNLITAVSGFTQLAMMQMDPASPAAADLKQVVAAADRAGHLTKQLLAFSRKQVLQPTVLDVGDVLRNMLPMIDRLLGDQVTLRAHVEDDCARVLSDRGQLEQVILNLAINARDAMPKGGVLKIVASNRHLKQNNGTPQPGHVIITVTDTGTGIPPAIRDRIFEPFFTTKEPGKGTGLGLSTVYGIVKQSGGTIEVQSRVGVGTTFTVALPAVTDAFDAIEASAPAAMPRGTETILLVEDDPAVRALSRRTLEDCGYTVLPAADPLDALRLAKTARVDVILSDMMMPNLTGAQFIERFLAEHPAPVVIFMSGFADEGLQSDGRALSAAYLRKPFTPLTLATTIRGAIDASRNTATIA